MRFFTVPDAKAARGSVAWAVVLIGSFYIMVMIIGLGARALLGQGGEEAAGTAGNLAVPNLALELGGGEGSTGGEIFLAVVAAVALATILAVVAGLVISASGAMAHDLWSNVVRKGHDSEKEEVVVAKLAAAGIGVAAILAAVVAGEGFNVSALVGLTFVVAASANFPALLLSLLWRRFNTTGAVTGILFGLLSSLFFIIMSPPVWPGADSETGSPLGSIALDNPAIYCIPLGFLGCWLGTVLSSESGAERTYDELNVRAQTGLGAEAGGEPVRGEERRPVGSAST